MRTRALISTAWIWISGRERWSRSLNKTAIYLDTEGNPVLSDTAAQGPANPNPGADSGQPGIFGAPAFFDGPSGPELYIRGGSKAIHDMNMNVIRTYGGRLARFKWTPATASSPPQLARDAVASFDFGDSTTPVISSNGQTSNTGLIWFLQRFTPAPNCDLRVTPCDQCPPYPPTLLRLVAYNVQNITGSAKVWTVGNWLHQNQPFIEPMVMDGRVYVGYSGAVAVFGR
jgi:hypothetical protein